MRSGEVHVWVENVDDSTAFELSASDLALLDPDERHRLACLARVEDRILYGRAHVGLRQILSHYADVDPASWKFGTNEHGRPEVRQPMSAAWIRFNLTHTRGLFAVVIANDREIGIDAEHLDRRTDVEGVAAHAFAPCEIDAIQAQSSEEARRALFFNYWTLKEAYLKARGTGLASALNEFWFTPGLERPIAIQFASGSHGPNDTPSGWQFDLIAPTPLTRLAVAMRRLPGEKPLAVRWLGPLRLRAAADLEPLRCASFPPSRPIRRVGARSMRQLLVQGLPIP